jgi:hypothetical protein
MYPVAGNQENGTVGHIVSIWFRSAQHLGNITGFSIEPSRN